MIFYDCTSILVSDIQTKNSQDSIFDMQRETYTARLLSFKKELETLQIQYDKYKSNNSDGRHNNELKKNRKAQVLFLFLIVYLTIF